MKCYFDERDVCHNIGACTLAHMCIYEHELIEKNREINMTEDIHHFESGASSSGHKPPYECLTITFIKRCALRMKLGFHYGKHNWKKGSKDKQFILDRLNHAMEHLIKVSYEIDNDIPMTDDDLAAIAVNCMFAMEYQEGQKQNGSPKS